METRILDTLKQDPSKISNTLSAMNKSLMQTDDLNIDSNDRMKKPWSKRS